MQNRLKEFFDLSPHCAIISEWAFCIGCIDFIVPAPSFIGIGEVAPTFTLKKNETHHLACCCGLVAAGFIDSSLFCRRSERGPQPIEGSSSAGTVNNKPIIGIFAQPSGHALKPFGDKYIAASYVKYIESAGARVVPIPYDLSQSELRTLFESLNGALFPGGTDLTNNDGSWTPYLKSLGLFVKWSMEAYDQNQDYFPIWGTCLGMQSITIILSNDPFILGTGFDSYNISMPFNFTNSLPDTQRLSRVFNSCPYSNMNTLATKAVTLNNHHDGVDVATWFKNDNCSFPPTRTEREENSFHFSKTRGIQSMPVNSTLRRLPLNGATKTLTTHSTVW